MPEFEISLNNNPRASFSLFDFQNEAFHELKNRPAVTVRARQIDSGSYPVSLRYDGAVLAEDTVSVDDTPATATIELPYVLEEPVTIDLDFGDYRETVSPELTHISGQARYFDGSPVEQVFVNSGGSSGFVVGDEKGSFDLTLDGRPPQGSLFISDDRYAQDSLECWVYGVDGQADMELQPTIGELELYNFHAWSGGGHGLLYVFFIPMSIVRMSKVRELGITSPAAMFDHDDTGPTLSADAISVAVGGTERPIRTIETVRDRPSGVESPRPAVLCSVPIDGDESLRDKAIHVSARDTVSWLDGVQRGEGYFMGFM